MTDRINASTPRRFAAALVAGSIAAFAGTASAQFVVETAETKPAVRDSSNQQQTIAVTKGNGESYKVTIEDGAIIEAWANGEPVDVSLVHKDDEGIYFLDDKGNITERFRLRIEAPASPVKLGVPLPPSQAQATGYFLGDPADSLRVAVGVKLPPVMLGINLSSPGDALRAQLGLGDLPAILVDGVIDGLPASKAGLKKYDIIVSLDGSEGSSSAKLSEVLGKKEAGDTLEMHVLRGGKKIELTAELVAYDAKALGQEPAFVFSDDPRFPGQAATPKPDQDVQVWVDRGQGRLELLEKDRSRQIEDMRRAFRERVTSEEEMRSKVAEAMREAERRVLELRDGQLFIREADEAARRAAEEIARLEHHLAKEMPEIEEELVERFAQIEDRFDAIERRFEEQAERLGDRMERLMGLMERMADRMERAFDED